MPRLVVISAGLRSPSSTRLLADRLTEAVERQITSAEVTSVELREHAHAIVDALLAGFPSDQLSLVIGAVEQADALIVVTPTFQGSYSGLFKAFVDLIEPGKITHTPVLLAATGGTERHSLVIEHALRPLFSYLGATTVPTGVYAATSDFGADTVYLDQRIERAASELAVLTSLECETPSTGPEESDQLDQARRALGRATGMQFDDFGDLLRAIGQG